MPELKDMKEDQENYKNLSDHYMQDYLDNFRRSIQSYNESFNRFSTAFVAEMDKSRDAVMKNIQDGVENINKRLKETHPYLAKEVEKQDGIETIRTGLMDIIKQADPKTLIGIVKILNEAKGDGEQ